LTLAVVVSDTSPIRALSHLARLELLGRLFSEVVIPPAVVHELEHPSRRFEPIPVQRIPNSRIITPSDPAAVSTLLAQLDAGEAEAIVVATEVGTDRILIDEALGRTIARARGLRPLGALGVLVRAKRLGLIDSVQAAMEQLQRELGFFVSDPVKARILKQAREA